MLCNPVQVVSGAEQAAAAEAGAGGELLGAFNVATFAGEVENLILLSCGKIGPFC